MVLRRTFSVCPECFRRVPAELTARGTEVFLEKICPDHGRFAAVVWRGDPGLTEWTGSLPEIGAADNLNCPQACGLCPDHRQGTCCVLLEVTGRCNLTCAHCFAGSSAAGGPTDPPLEQVKEWVADIARAGRVFLQLSGGEPTLRDDLPQIISHARAMGCEYVQLNSNGLRLAEDEAYLRALAEAGLSFVFLQFDGTTDAIYRRLRGRNLLSAKLEAIDQCGRAGLGVTLVPTVVPGVNTDDLGNIVRLAVERSPAVRGVHFQPVSYFGRFPRPPLDAHRVTLPEVLTAIYAQAWGLVPPDSLAPSHCDHARCGFHGAYINTREGLKPLTEKSNNCCCEPAPAEKNRHFVGRRWSRPASLPGIPMAQTAPPEAKSLTNLDGFLSAAKSHSFTLSAMAFQDAYTLDLERLRQCSLHVYSNGRLVPFCSHYLTPGR